MNDGISFVYILQLEFEERRWKKMKMVMGIIGKDGEGHDLAI